MNRLKELRKTKGLTLDELSKELKKNHGVLLSTGQLSSYENGKRSPREESTWETIADFFGVNTAYLLGYSDFPASILRDNLFYKIKLENENMVIRLSNDMEGLLEAQLAIGKSVIESMLELIPKKGTEMTTIPVTLEDNKFEIEVRMK